MWRLLYPLRYFRLVNDEKRHIDMWPTMLLAAIIALPFILLHDAPFFHKDGFLDKLLILDIGSHGLLCRSPRCRSDVQPSRSR